MSVRRLLRLALVVVALAIGVVIWWQWRPVEADDGAAVELEVPEDRTIASRSEGLRVTQSANGQLVFELRAAEQVDFADGWNVYDDVELRIPTAEAEAEDAGDPADVPSPGSPCGGDGCIRIDADTLRASGRVPNFDELRFIGNVVVDMPGGLHFETRRLDYDPVTGVVSNCNRNELAYAGLDVRADCLRFETGGDVARDRRLRARELEMWGDLVVQTSEDAPSLPPGLRGGAERMRFRPDAEEVSLLGEPQLEMSRARVVGEEIFLTLADGARRLDRVRAVGEAVVDWSPPTAPVPAPGEAGDGGDGEAGAGPAPPRRRDAPGRSPESRGEPSPRQRLRGDVVVLELADQEGSETVLARGREGGRATFEVEGTGRLQGREISAVGAEGRARVSAFGEVVWRSDAAAAPVPRLDAGTLVLELDSGSLRSLQAVDDVVADVASGEDGEARQFRGNRLQLQWGPDGALTDGAWPEGVGFDAGDRTLRAARARRDPKEAEWVLDGVPRPGVRADLFELEADELRVDDAGDLRAEGEVAGELDAGSFGAGAALFGGVERVSVRAGEASMRRGAGLRLGRDVQVLWREQSLVADRLLVVGDPGRLQATGEVELVVAADDPAAADDAGDDRETATADDAGARRDRGGGAGLLIATARALLVDGDPAEIRLAGDSRVQIGDRRISSQRVVISPGAEGGWRRFTAEESVEFEAPLGRGSGVRLDYDLDRRELVMEGDEGTPARFELADDPDGEGGDAGGGLSPTYESSGALRIRWLEETVEIAAIEDGRTRTSVVPRQQRDGEGAQRRP